MKILWLILAFMLLPVQAEPVSSQTEKIDSLLIYREAGVSPEQEVKIRQMAHEYEKLARVRIEKMRTLGKQLKTLSYEMELDEGRILAIQNEINELQSSVNSDRLKLLVNIRKNLSAEQKSKLIQIMQDKEQKKSRLQ